MIMSMTMKMLQTRLVAAKRSVTLLSILRRRLRDVAADARNHSCTHREPPFLPRQGGGVSRRPPKTDTENGKGKGSVIREGLGREGKRTKRELITAPPKNRANMSFRKQVYHGAATENLLDKRKKCKKCGKGLNELFGVNKVQDNKLASSHAVYPTKSSSPRLLPMPSHVPSKDPLRKKKKSIKRKKIKKKQKIKKLREKVQGGWGQ